MPDNYIEWTPPRDGRLRRLVLERLLDLRDRGLITIWIEDRHGVRVYIIHDLTVSTETEEKTNE